MGKSNKAINDLELVENEIDVRGLNAKDYRQLMFRIQIKNNEMLSQIMMNGVETSLILRKIAEQMGVEDIDKAIDDIFSVEQATEQQ